MRARRGMPGPTVVLFDIDGTLVTCGGAGRRAMERVFVEELGDASVVGFGFGGMTDRAIVREAFTRAAVALDEARMDAVLERYLTHLADELPRSAGYAVLDGVMHALETLEALRERGAPIAIGLGTGNLVRGAELKLSQAGLWERFSFGGFGSDHEDRPALLARGAARGRELLGHDDSESASVVVIGDTPRDILAAHAIGARCIAVASGAYDHESLATHGPHRLLRSLLELSADDVLEP